MNPPAAKAILVALAFTLPTLAVAQGGLTLQMESFQEVVTTAEDGKQERKRVPAAKVLPGGEVIYVLTYRNNGKLPVTNAVINNPLPAQVNYLAGSATGTAANLVVSVDGGKTYGVLPSLKVKGDDGVERPARADDVTHLRWTLSDAIAPGTEGTVSYRAVLK